jgi:tagatose 6-phosphate kinase
VILCLSASPALDLTYRVEGLRVGGTNRVREVSERPGGKAINVARLLHALGTAVHVLTTAGGDTGVGLIAGLTERGISHTAVPSTVPTRRTTTVVDEASGAVTVLSERAALRDWAGFVAQAEPLIATADVVVISGSPPDDVPVDGFAQLVTAARSLGRPVVLDTSGPALAAALSAGPTVIKPNADELRELCREADPVTAAESVAEHWGTCVVASLGPDGLMAATPQAAWRARPPRVLAGNATGAGDAVVAGLARGLSLGTAWPSLLADCVALGSAAVLAPCAGELDQLDYQRAATGVTVATVERASR